MLKQTLHRFFFSNTDYNIELQYPTNWTTRELDLKAGQVVALYPNDFEYVQVLPVIVQIFVRQSPVDNILIFGQTVTDNLKQNVDIRLVSDSMDNFLSDRVAYQRITYNYENEKTMKVLNISTIQKGELFELVYVAEPECFDEYLPAVNSMIESFKITR